MRLSTLLNAVQVACVSPVEVNLGAANGLAAFPGTDAAWVVRTQSAIVWLCMVPAGKKATVAVGLAIA
jgi:hypothetical protein